MSDPVDSYTEPRNGAWTAICASPKNARHPNLSKAATLENLVCIVDDRLFQELIRIEFTDTSVRAVFPVKHVADFSHDEQVKVLRNAKVIAIVVTDGEETVTRQVWPNESHRKQRRSLSGLSRSGDYILGELTLKSLRTIGVNDESSMELRVHWEIEYTGFSRIKVATEQELQPTTEATSG